MKLIELSQQLGRDLYSTEVLEDYWKLDKTQPRFVSTINPRDIEDNHAFFLDDIFSPGNWGAVDQDGNILIEPQFLFVDRFRNNRAIVAKGKWEYRDNWGYQGKEYSGYWYESELYGVIDRDGNEIIPCTYEEIESVSYWEQEEYIVKVIEYKDGHKTRLCELVDTEDGKVIVPKERGYSDFGEYPDDLSKDEFGQIISAIGGSAVGYYGSKPRIGVFDLNTLEDIIKPQYDYVELCGKGLFLVGDLDKNDNEKNGTLINSKNEPILKRNDIWMVAKKDKEQYEITFRDKSKTLIKPEYDSEGIVKIIG